MLSSKCLKLIPKIVHIFLYIKAPFRVLNFRVIDNIVRANTCNACAHLIPSASSAGLHVLCHQQIEIQHLILKDTSTPRIQLHFLKLSQKIIMAQSSVFPQVNSFIFNAYQLSFLKEQVFIFYFSEVLLVCFVLSRSSACLENFSEKEKLIFHCPVDLRPVISAKVSSCLLIIILAIAVMCFPTLSPRVLWL